MKCFCCGYYRILDRASDLEKLVKELGKTPEEIMENNGKRDFIVLEGTFSISRERCNENTGWRRFQNWEEESVNLYVCPKCGTVKMNDFLLEEN